MTLNTVLSSMFLKQEAGIFQSQSTMISYLLVRGRRNYRSSE